MGLTPSKHLESNKLNSTVTLTRANTTSSISIDSSADNKPCMVVYYTDINSGGTDLRYGCAPLYYISNKPCYFFGVENRGNTQVGFTIANGNIEMFQAGSLGNNDKMKIVGIYPTI